VILVDVNLLLYAHNPSAEQHARARPWLETALSGEESVGLPWIVLLAFLRLTTSPRVFPKPLGTIEAAEIVESWLASPTVTVPSPGERHWRILRPLLESERIRGPETTDAHLAALALEHGATFCTSDRGFARFRGLKLLNPMAG
jgi:hypothetical protein